MKPISKSFIDEAPFPSASRSKITENNEFMGISKIEGKNKKPFDARDPDLFPSRAPVHAGSSPKAKGTGRGNSPATGALAGGENAVKSESKSQLNHQTSSANLNNIEDSF